MKKGLGKIGVVLLTVLTLSACSTSEGANENTSTEKLESQTSETSTVISSSSSEEVAESSSSEEVIESSDEIVEMSNEEKDRRINEAVEKIKAQYDESSYKLSFTYSGDDYAGNGAIYVTYTTPFVTDMVWNAKHKDQNSFKDYKLLKQSFWEMFCTDLNPKTRIVFIFGEGNIYEFESTVDKTKSHDSIEKYYYGYYD